MTGFSSLIRHVFRLADDRGENAAATGQNRAAVFLSQAEKRELERVLIAELTRHYDDHGAVSLLAPDLCILIDGSELVIQPKPQESSDFLACVEIRSLFSAQCALAVGLEQTALPRDVLPDLATEATSAIAAQVNRLA